MRVLLILLVGCGSAADDSLPDLDGGADANPDPRFDEPRGSFVVRESRAVFDGTEQRFGRVDGSVLAGEPSSFHVEIDRAGACRYLAFEPGFCEGGCDGICNADGQCLPFPERESIGPVTIEGLSVGDLPLSEPITGSYTASQLPDDLFEPGTSIRLVAGDLSIATAAPAALEGEPSGETLVLPEGAGAEIRWTPGGRGDRVRLVLRSPNQGHGLPLDAIIECDGPDSGAFAIPRAWVEQFPAGEGLRICVGHDCPPSELWRYRVASRDDIELVIASERSFMVAREAAAR